MQAAPDRMSASRSRMNRPRYRQTGRQRGQIAQQQINIAPEWAATGQTALSQAIQHQLGSESPERDAVDVGWSKSVLIMRTRTKQQTHRRSWTFEGELVTMEINGQNHDGHIVTISPATMELAKHSGYREKLLYL